MLLDSSSSATTILLTSGIVCLVASIIGGGLKAFNFELPSIVNSISRQIILGMLGITLIIISFRIGPNISPEHNNRNTSIAGQWNIFWQSKNSNWRNTGMARIEQDGDNSYKGHLHSKEFATNLFLDDDFSFLYTNDHIKFFVKTPCPDGMEYYDLVYNANSDNMSGSYEHRGNLNCIGNDYGTITFERIR